jgi:hypothetical protein
MARRNTATTSSFSSDHIGDSNMVALAATDYNEHGTPIRFITHNGKKRELRQYQGYWYIILTPGELEDWEGVHWHGYVLVHKWKYWVKYGEWYGRDEAMYRYLDGDRDNIRITNIGVLTRAGEWL